MWLLTTSISRPRFPRGAAERFAALDAVPLRATVRVHLVRTSRGVSWNDSPSAGVVALVQAAMAINGELEEVGDWD